MKIYWAVFLILNFITHSASEASAAPLTWHLIPENVEELPLEITYDSTGAWEEVWVRPPTKPLSAPRLFMEQGLGVRWVGLDPDSNGKPARVIIVYNETDAVEITPEKTTTGKLEKGILTWSDGKQAVLVGNKKKRGSRKRSRRAKKVHFGKINLPPLNFKSVEMEPLAFQGLDTFIQKISGGPSTSMTTADQTLITRLSDSAGGGLRMRYASDCKETDKTEIENLISGEVGDKLTCWMQQNPEKNLWLLSALVQKPLVSCKTPAADVCGRASLPLVEGFFATQAKLEFNMGETCSENLNMTVLHEVLHLAGIKDGDEMDAAVTQANSCESFAANLSFEGPGDEFFNDLQVETRLLLFKKVREESVEKWGWTEGEKDYVLGTICTKMGDKFCSRRYFQLATEAGGSGSFSLPEGGEISFAAAAHFGLFDSITEDLARMHELVRYLSRDPNGVLLKRLESGTHRMHEFYVARNALEQIRNNKGICGSEVDDKVACEDLAQIAKYPWFNR